MRDRSGHAEAGAAPDGATDPAGAAFADGAGIAHADAAARLEEVGDVLAHDLRNHLTVASGNLELARQGDDERPFDAVATALERIEALVDEVVVLARTGQLAERTQPVAFEAVVEEAWAGVPTASADCTVEGSAELVANRAALRHLLENLLQNAVEHAGPAVSIRAGSLPDGFYVEDDGPGIPEGERDRVFESGVGGVDGTGLGLTIVERIARAHGWAIDVVEGRAGGARFEVRGVERP